MSNGNPISSKGRLLKSLLGISKAEHLRSLANEMRLSSGILNECATLFEDVDRLLGALAECFDESEEEFSDIRDMRGRIRGDLVAPARPAHEPEAEHVCDGGWACHFHDARAAQPPFVAIERGCYVLMEMMKAYERRIRSDCKTAEEIERRPWECAEYIAASDFLRKAWPPSEKLGAVPPPGAAESWNECPDCGVQWLGENKGHRCDRGASACQLLQEIVHEYDQTHDGEVDENGRARDWSAIPAELIERARRLQA